MLHVVSQEYASNNNNNNNDNNNNNKYFSVSNEYADFVV